jgi:hypothetical protein
MEWINHTHQKYILFRRYWNYTGCSKILVGKSWRVRPRGRHVHMGRSGNHVMYTYVYLRNTIRGCEPVCVGVCVCVKKGQLVSECPLDSSSVKGVWPVVVKHLLSSKRGPHFKTRKCCKEEKYGQGSRGDPEPKLAKLAMPAAIYPTRPTYRVRTEFVWLMAGMNSGLLWTLRVKQNAGNFLSSWGTVATRRNRDH